MKYDFVIVGAGLFGATIARILTDAGRSVLVVDKASYVGGLAYTEVKENIIIHSFGPHLFHSKNKDVWDFVNRFSLFNHYHHCVKANYNDKIISLPFNLMTFHQLWGCVTPDDAQRELEKRKVPIDNPQNLEEWCLSQVGEEIYYTLVYYYTKKQWMREPKDLPASIIQRLPIRLSYNDWYFDDPYQGIPVNGYTPLIEAMLEGIKVRLNTPFSEIKNWQQLGKHLIYSGRIDEFFECRHGELEYRTLEFQHIVKNGNFQGIGQMNYTNGSSAYTRVIEHKHFYFAEDLPKTIVSYEFPVAWTPTSTPCYPITDNQNQTIYQKYLTEATQLPNVTFGGRLGSHAYLDMDQIIYQAMQCGKTLM